ncbi:glycosyltransferase [Neorhizobium galegae]|uniref:CgeB family protein n=1 Tax=Neorhizobium galegae TaxID=399 RepID=UPI00062241CF|nr:glycosyltransferase [Neorhizobium galegae]CDZ27686.1 CgeB family protein [Neorhizobium galegae bv. officinalis]KAA9386680.1 glycosyltransferase [Neorhizobium galegae]KAB1109066.1 glycosyltransferase [Neorhizobium galegae]MCM2501480.1 glycosyltransferase [Neorhizobium galegae]MCQ1772431.1 glycosyltransferase [Neorhizobium galegae]
MRLLYIGAESGTSLQRAAAFGRIGLEVLHLSPYAQLPTHWAPWLNRAGGPGIDRLVANGLGRRIGGQRFDFAVVDCGDVVGPAALKIIRNAAPVVVNYNADNPYLDPSPERLRWTIFHRALPYYDLVVAMRRDGIEEMMARRGARRIDTIWQCADEVVHRPPSLTPEEKSRWSSEVVFVGTWMPGRGAFLARLIEKGLPLAIHGARWKRATEYRLLRPLIRSDHLEAADYTRAISGAKIALVLLNGRNADLHTTRSAEIPAIGTAICAPRTPHHQQLYKEGEEAVLFDGADECAEACKRLLADDGRRQTIADAGHRRTFANGTYNEALTRRIVERVAEITRGGGR